MFNLQINKLMKSIFCILFDKRKLYALKREDIIILLLSGEYLRTILQTYMFNLVNNPYLLTS